MGSLVIIRGNSGSEKTSTAYEVRKKLLKSHKIAIVEQDLLRRQLLKEKDGADNDSIDLIKLAALFALERGYDVIVEGILRADWYGDMLRRLVSASEKSHVFYLNTSFEETLRRHATKPNAHEFGENEMKNWYQFEDVLGVKDEMIIGEDVSQSELVDQICYLIKK